MFESDSAEHMFDAGQDLLADGDYSAAAESFAEVIRLCPQMEGAWGNRGFALYELGNDEDALRDYEMVISINPEDVLGYSFKSLALRNLGRYEEALEAAVTAIELADADLDAAAAFLARGWMFANAHQYAAACDDLERFCAVSPEDTVASGLLAICRRYQDERGVKICEYNEDGKLDCHSCKYPDCGYSFDFTPNYNWEEEGGVCCYSHCIRNMPARDGDGGKICPLYGHDCPGGSETVMRCPMVDFEAECFPGEQ